MTENEKKSCDGCIWYRGYFPKIRCFNITMADRKGWNPLPVERCEEYKSAEVRNPKGPGTIPEHKGQSVHRKSVPTVGTARNVPSDKTRQKVSRPRTGKRSGD